MKYGLHSQIAVPNSDSSTLGVLTEICLSNEYDKICFASAYATVEGAKRLLEIFDDIELQEINWLIGLDDYFTQPRVLENLSNIQNSTLKTVSNNHNKKTIFHPKIIFLQNSNNPILATMVIGSSNLTARGLITNTEVSSIFHAETELEVTQLTEFWMKYWVLGNELTNELLVDYRAKYNAVKERRKNAGLDGLKDIANPADDAAPQANEILGNDNVEILPEDATVCWIEVGKITGRGRELEIKAEQALFFGLVPAGGDAQTRQFIVSDGTPVELRLKYQTNSMWRLQMNNEVPEVAIGLRPTLQDGGLGRSLFVAVFTRVANGYELRFIDEDNDEYVQIQNQSRMVNAIGSTIARRYGWY